MARINLLPWRQEERERKNKEFGVVLIGAFIITALAVLLAMTFLNSQLSSQRQANQMITDENTRLDGVLTEIADLEQRRDEMLSQMKVIQDLQGRRSIPVRIWDDIARAMPASMYLVSIKREGEVITINGFADNPNVVSQLVKNLDASPWLINSLVPQIKTKAEAYENVKNSATPTSNMTQNNTLGTGERQILPEDSYIEFTVTTQVAPAETEEGAQTLAADANAVPAANPSAPATPAPANATAPAAQPTQTAPAPTQPTQTAPAPTQPAQPAAQPAQAAPSAAQQAATAPAPTQAAPAQNTAAPASQAPTGGN